MLAYVVETKKIMSYEKVYFTSSMDFAEEEGFAHNDDAKKMWTDAEAILLCKNHIALEESVLMKEIV